MFGIVVVGVIEMMIDRVVRAENWVDVYFGLLLLFLSQSQEKRRGKTNFEISMTCLTCNL